MGVSARFEPFDGDLDASAREYVPTAMTHGYVAAVYDDIPQLDGLTGWQQVLAFAGASADCHYGG